MSKDSGDSKNSGSSGQVSSWYEDRYQSLVVQRNLFFVIIVACVAVIVASVLIIGVLSEKKTIEPMVIEIEDKSGITNVVNPDTDRRWTVDESINKYFLMKYLNAREAYDVATYDYNFNTVVRLLSSEQVYNQFKNYIGVAANNPVALYGANVNTKISIRSILFLPNKVAGQSAQIRFSVETSDGRSFSKIAQIIWNYVTLNLSFKDRMVNPIGFQIQSYSIADDVNG